MAEKRKDNKGRNLFTGESQRKDGSYMYRCTDDYGKRHTVYAPTLKELREKEKKLQKDIVDGMTITDGNITVSELLQIYFESNKKWKPGTANWKKFIIDVINRYSISQLKLNEVKISNIKSFYLLLNDKGIAINTIKGYHHVLRPAFEIAVQDDWIRKNPCQFKFDFLPSTSKVRPALTQEQEIQFLQFVKETESLAWYYDIFVLMLETGMRLSETIGLTLSDIDLDQRKISINKQLCVSSNKINNKRVRYIDTLKTENGQRDIYISNKAYQSLLRLIARRNEETSIELMIGQYTGFLLKSHKQSKIVTQAMIENNLKKAVKLYNQSHKDKIPLITPHSLRHTFCTRMVERGIDIKSLQYTMGHADVRMTLDIYTHMTGKVAMESMRKALECSV